MKPGVYISDCISVNASKQFIDLPFITTALRAAKPKWPCGQHVPIPGVGRRPLSGA